MSNDADEFLPTRWSLLSRLKDWDDQQSWRDFFDAYWKLIYSTALKAGLTHAEAQEVVQETVIAVAKKMGDFRTDPAQGSFKNWLLHLTRWRITDQFRKRGRQEQRAHQPANPDTARTATVERVPDPAAVDLDAEWEAEWEKNLVATALERIKDRVKPEQLQIFNLLVRRDWPALKVARRLRVGLTQVYYAKFRVTSLIKEEVKKLEKQIT
ncbi:MAG: sigma-70 family RNA polymerase sigma factor [Verrucomicrobia bacterium]|nr:sigma-70 family RNA polymerase sigma factor [Verrucomicrobiota bacterium]